MPDTSRGEHEHIVPAETNYSGKNSYKAEGENASAIMSRVGIHDHRFGPHYRISENRDTRTHDWLVMNSENPDLRFEAR